MQRAYGVLQEKGTLRDDLDLVLSFDELNPMVDLNAHYDLEARYADSGAARP